MERLIKQLASLPFAQNWPDKDECLARLQAVIQTKAKLYSFKLTRVEKGSGFIDTVSFSRKNTKKLQEVAQEMVKALFGGGGGGDDGGGGGGAAAEVAPGRREAYTQWQATFEHYVKAVELLRIIPDFDRDDPEFEAKANAAAAAYQTEADAFGRHLLHESIAFNGDAVIANYVHDILAGHVAALIRKWGCVSLFSNDASEAKNQDLCCMFRRHSQMGGCAGRGSVLKSKSDAIARWSARMVIRLTGYDAVVEEEWRAGAAERRKRWNMVDEEGDANRERAKQAKRTLRQDAGAGVGFSDAMEVEQAWAGALDEAGQEAWGDDPEEEDEDEWFS